MDETKNELSKAREQFEQEKMTRRSALRKFGITTGMSVFGLFAVDDLARMVIGKMQEHEATKQIADGLAREFKDAGAVKAVPCGVDEDCGLCGICGCQSSCTPTTIFKCVDCGGLCPSCKKKQFDCASGSGCAQCCDQKKEACIAAGLGEGTCQTYWDGCIRNCS